MKRSKALLLHIFLLLLKDNRHMIWLQLLLLLLHDRMFLLHSHQHILQMKDIYHNPLILTPWRRPRT